MNLKIDNVDIQTLTENDFNTIQQTELISKTISLFERNDFNSILVLDGKEHVLGSVTLEQILNNLNLSSTVKKIMTTVPLLQNPSLLDLLETFVTKKIDLIPIVNQYKKLQHVVSIFKLAETVVNNQTIANQNTVDKQFLGLDTNDSFEQTLSKIRKNYHDILPVLNNGKLTGVIITKQLLPLMYEAVRDTRGDKKGEKQGQYINIDGIIQDPSSFSIILQESFSGNELIELIIKNRTQSVIIVNEQNTVVGIINLRNILRFILNAGKSDFPAYQVRVLSAPDSDIENIAYKKLTSLLERHHNFFGESVDPEATSRFRKIEHQSQRGMFRYDVEIRVSFGKGKEKNFSVASADWGAEKALNKSYQKLSRIIADKRKIAKNHPKESLRTLEEDF